MAANKKAFDFEVTLKHPLSKLWNAMTGPDSQAMWNAAAPEYYSNFESCEGPWCEKGSFFVVKHGDDWQHYRYSKETWEEVDRENHFVRWSVMEGGALGQYASKQNNSVKFLPGPDADSCIMRFSVEYESVGEHDFYEAYKASMIRTMQGFASHLDTIADK